MLFVVGLSALACNLQFGSQNATPVTPTAPGPQTTPTAAPSPAAPPQVVIESPESGAQTVIQQPLTVRVHATDSSGITRVEMRESGRIAVSQPLPDPDPNLTALLIYRPMSLGKITLEVVAYRQGVASNSAQLVIEVVGSAAELRKPGSVKPTAGAAPGAVCSVFPTISGLSLRSGPGTNFRYLGSTQIGDELNVIGRNASGTWYQITRNNGTFVGWVSGGYVSVAGDCNKAPVHTPSP